MFTLLSYRHCRCVCRCFVSFADAVAGKAVCSCGPDVISVAEAASGKATDAR